jgi:outer membrane protein
MPLVMTFPLIPRSVLKGLHAAAWLLAATAASAQSFEAVRMFAPVQGSGLGTAGAAVVATRQYAGSDDQRTLVLPVLNYRWANGWFAGTGNGVGYRFESPEHLQYGVRLTYDAGRRSKRSPVLAGMDNIGASPEAGGFFNLFVSRQVFFTSSLRYGAGDGHDGLLLDLGANFSMLLAPQWRATTGIGATVANGRYMQSYFGVNANKATAARPAYNADGGLRDVRASASLTYFITPKWDAILIVTAASLRGDARKSPLVRDRSPVTGVVAVTRDF